MLFTGIVQGQAKVERILDSAKGSEFRTVTLGFPTPQTSASVGASVAINGTCLTIVSIEDGGRALTFDIIDETLRRTNLGDLVEGSAVNYERAARYGDEIGGHCVSGHVVSARGDGGDSNPTNTRVRLTPKPFPRFPSSLPNSTPRRSFVRSIAPRTA